MSLDLLVDQENLAFFNALSGTLEIELTEPAKPIAGLLNLAAPKSARIALLRLDAEVFDDDAGVGRAITEQEMDMVVFRGRSLRLCGESGLVVTHHAPDGGRFRVRDLLNAVEATEVQSRGATEWLGGVDVHHIYFEGIHLRGDGVWAIYWGS